MADQALAFCASDEYSFLASTPDTCTITVQEGTAEEQNLGGKPLFDVDGIWNPAGGVTKLVIEGNGKAIEIADGMLINSTITGISITLKDVDVTLDMSNMEPEQRSFRVESATSVLMKNVALRTVGRPGNGLIQKIQEDVKLVDAEFIAKKKLTQLPSGLIETALTSRRKPGLEVADLDTDAALTFKRLTVKGGKGVLKLSSVTVKRNKFTVKNPDVGSVKCSNSKNYVCTLNGKVQAANASTSTAVVAGAVAAGSAVLLFAVGAVVTLLVVKRRRQQQKDVDADAQVKTNDEALLVDDDDVL